MHLRPFAINPGTRRIAAEDFSLISSWWTARNQESPSLEMLPGLGFIAFDKENGTPLATCSAYLDATGSGVARLAYAATNPAASPLARGKALAHVLDLLIQHIQSLNYWLINASFNQPALLRFLKKHNFRTAETVPMENLYLNLATSWE